MQKDMVPQDSQMQANGLSRLLHLHREMRRSGSVEELMFLVMNETRQVIAYDEAFLFFDTDGANPVLQCISGLATFERETPKIAWLEKNIGTMRARTKGAMDPVIVPLADMPDSMREGWAEYMSPEGIIVPYRIGKIQQDGFLLLARAQPWTDKDAKILSEIAENMAYAYGAHKAQNGFSFFTKSGKQKKKIWLMACAATLLVLFWPVRETLIADMEITPISPWIATAPLDGVIRKIHVEPNARVKAGDLLFEMDDTSLRNDLVLAKERLEIARQELWQARQQAVAGSGAGDKKSDASLLSLEVQKKENEARYYEELLQKSKIYSTKDGVPVFGAASEIEGRPAKTGEGVMVVADPEKVDVTINMSATDAIIIKPGDEALVYLHAASFDPLKATVRYVSYKAQKSDVPDQMVYKIKADLGPKDVPPRLGLKGTARVKGERTTLFYAIFRKPIGYIRRMAGI